ncbi:MAG TPA: hypothetical protein VN969_43530 [Streptosporangiaceae bacterium]|nr:hypothetical protein [Streptosporangiaceae bacterium]
MGPELGAGAESLGVESLGVGPLGVAPGLVPGPAVGRPGTAVPRAVAGTRLELLVWVLAPPLLEAPQATMPSSPRPRARVIARRRQ